MTFLLHHTNFLKIIVNKIIIASFEHSTQPFALKSETTIILKPPQRFFTFLPNLVLIDFLNLICQYWLYHGEKTKQRVLNNCQVS